ETIPERLGVVVRVQIDDAGRHELAIGVDHRRGAGVDAADLGDAAVLDAHVRAVAREARAVHDHAILDDQVVSHGSSGSTASWDVAPRAVRRTGTTGSAATPPPPSAARRRG